MRRATVTPDGWTVAKLADGWWVLKRTAPQPTPTQEAMLMLRGEFHITEWRQQCGPYRRRYDAAQYALRKAHRVTTQGV